MTHGLNMFSSMFHRSLLYRRLCYQSLLLSICCLFVDFACGSGGKTPKDMEKKMEELGFKEILDKPAEYLIDLSYENGKYPVKAGDKVDINKIYEKPSSVSWEAELGEWFTLVFFDYDAPERQRPELRSFIHWMIANIPEKSLTAGTMFYDYYGPKLFYTKDVHRYAMIIYKQKEKLESFREPFINNQAKSIFPELDPRNMTMTDALRAHFNRTEFEEKYEFNPPYAMTFFSSELAKS